MDAACPDGDGEATMTRGYFYKDDRQPLENVIYVDSGCVVCMEDAEAMHVLELSYSIFSLQLDVKFNQMKKQRADLT